MKIEDILSIALTPAKPEAKPSSGADFAEHLKEALATEAQNAASTQGPAGLLQLSALDAVGKTGINPTEALEAVLSRLDNYREALANPDLSLKKISTLVQGLEQDSQQLQALAQNLPANSPLKKVVEEAAALAYTESFKFNRGDYV